MKVSTGLFRSRSFPKVRSRLVSLCLFTSLVVALGVAPTPATAADGALFEEAVGFKSRGQEPWVLRSRDVFVDFSLLEGAAEVAEKSGSGWVFLDLELFDDVRVAAALDHIERSDRDALILAGRVAGYDDSRIVLVARGNVLVGSVRVLGEMYRIRYSGEAAHVIEKLDEGALPQESLPIQVPASAEKPKSGSDNGSIFDLLVVYSTAAKNGAGGTTAIENLIQLGVSETNMAFANSGVIPRFRLVHTAELQGYSEGAGLDLQLSRLRNTSDGIADEVHALRDAHAADFVTLIVNDGAGSCGIGYIMAGSNNSAFAASAFNITARSCISPNYTFGHELGHNMGCNHAPVDPTGTGAFSYSFGYKDPNRLFRTIMAYNCSGGGCTRELQFSNPNVTLLGRPTGTSTQNNATSINNVRSVLANFRQSSPQLPEIRVRLLPQGTNVPDGGAYAFPSTPLAQLPVDQQFEICNDGSGSLTIDNRSSLVSGTAFSQVGSPAGSIAPGTCSVFRARFNTGAAGGHSGAITIQNNDSNEDPFDIRLSGTATSPLPEIRLRRSSDGVTVPDGGSYTFPTTLLPDLPITRGFDICNDGNANLTISNRLGLVSGTAFTQIGAPSSTVAAGTCSSFQVRFDAAIAATFPGAITVRNNDSNEDPYNVSLSGTASAPSPEIRVGLVPQGTNIPDGGSFTFPTTPVANLPRSQLFELCNDGTANLTIDNPSSLVSGVGFKQIGTAPVSPVAPGACTDFRVRFHVASAGHFSGAVTIQNNDSNEDPYNISLAGTATSVEPEIRVALVPQGTNISDGGSFTFPTTPVANLPRSQLFELCNDGNMNLVIDNPSSLVSGVGFSQIGAAPVSPVLPGACTNFRVRFHVANAGNYSGAVTIENNDLNEDPFNISLSGIATAPSPEIRVALVPQGTNITDGGSFTFPTTPVANLPRSQLFELCNDGAGDLVIDNPGSLVIGTGFKQIGTLPASPVSPGTCTDFRVRFHVANPGIYSGTVSIENNDPNEDPFNFTVGGTATN